MKKKILVTLILAFGICGILWINGSSRVDSKYIQKEIPASPQQAEVLKMLMSEVVKACQANDFGNLKVLFPYSPEERELLKAENGADPVEQSLSILRKYGKEISLNHVHCSSLENSSKLFFATGKTNSGNSVRIKFRKYPNGYGILGIAEL